jgi:hypothetical protein
LADFVCETDSRQTRYIVGTFAGQRLVRTPEMIERFTSYGEKFTFHSASPPPARFLFRQPQQINVVAASQAAIRRNHYNQDSAGGMLGRSDYFRRHAKHRIGHLFKRLMIWARAEQCFLSAA